MQPTTSLPSQEPEPEPQEPEPMHPFVAAIIERIEESAQLSGIPAE